MAGLPESDDQSELPSPPALSMSLSAKGQLTNIGQHHGDAMRPGGRAGGLGFRLKLGSPVRAGSRSLHSPTPCEPEGQARRDLELRGGPGTQGVAGAASDSLSVGKAMNRGPEQKPVLQARRQLPPTPCATLGARLLGGWRGTVWAQGVCPHRGWACPGSRAE